MFELRVHYDYEKNGGMDCIHMVDDHIRTAVGHESCHSGTCLMEDSPMRDIGFEFDTFREATDAKARVDQCNDFSPAAVFVKEA